MRIAALCHTEMARKLIVLRVVASSTVELALGHSPDETFRLEVVGELVAEFQKLEEWRSRLERPGARVYDLLLLPPHGQVRLADRLDEAARQLAAELAAQWDVDANLEVLWTSAT
jgi:hypothetical protein